MGGPFKYPPHDRADALGLRATFMTEAAVGQVCKYLIDPGYIRRGYRGQSAWF